MWARKAETYNQPPSALLGITEPLVALAVDDALWLRLMIWKDEQVRLAEYRSKAKGSIPAGQHYVSVRDELQRELSERKVA